MKRLFGSLSQWSRVALAGVAATAFLSGCGGGGGGSSSSGGGGTPQAQTVTITGQLKDQTTSNVLPSRTVLIQNTSLSAVSDSQGNFTISSVPVGTITFTVTDSNGASDGSASVDLTKLSGNPRNVGTVVLNIYGSGGPPAPPI